MHQDMFHSLSIYECFCKEFSIHAVGFIDTHRRTYFRQMFWKARVEGPWLSNTSTPPGYISLVPTTTWWCEAWTTSVVKIYIIPFERHPDKHCCGQRSGGALAKHHSGTTASTSRSGRLSLLEFPLRIQLTKPDRATSRLQPGVRRMSRGGYSIPVSIMIPQAACFGCSVLHAVLTFRARHDLIDGDRICNHDAPVVLLLSAPGRPSTLQHDSSSMLRSI